MILGMRRVNEHGDGGHWMPFHLEVRDDEDQLGSMDRISEKERIVSRDISEIQDGLKYLI